jgi:hypothetical protein
VAAVFALGLFPDEPMSKTELAARQYQRLVTGDNAPAVASSQSSTRSGPSVPQAPDSGHPR